MDFTISSGGKRQTRAMVDDLGRVYTRSDCFSMLAQKSKSCGGAYILSSVATPYTLSNTNEHKLAYFKNTNQGTDFHVDDITVTWNGGSTNHNRCLTVKFYDSPGIPSAGHVAVPLSPLNSRLSLPAVSTVYLWDNATSGGMTWSGGTVFSGIICGQGISVVDAESAMIIGFDKSFGLSVVGEEVGTFIILLSGFFAPIDNDLD